MCIRDRISDCQKKIPTPKSLISDCQKKIPTPTVWCQTLRGSFQYQKVYFRLSGDPPTRKSRIRLSEEETHSKEFAFRDLSLFSVHPFSFLFFFVMWLILVKMIKVFLAKSIDRKHSNVPRKWHIWDNFCVISQVDMTITVLSAEKQHKQAWVGVWRLLVEC